MKATYDITVDVDGDFTTEELEIFLQYKLGLAIIENENPFITHLEFIELEIKTP